jgi:RNA polymerase sigma-70 factor, ECF subfamily
VRASRGRETTAPRIVSGSVVVWVDDEVLLGAARAGDEEAFAELVRRHQVRVYRVALRMLGSDADAQDAAQESFVAAWRALPRFRGESAVATWLYRIVTNRCLNRLASRRTDSPMDAHEEPSGARDPALLAEQRAHLDAISHAVALLPDDQRAALVLRDYEGLSYEEVADVLRISVGAVKSRIHRARGDVLKRTLAWR